jgi:hypothetical protein
VEKLPTQIWGPNNFPPAVWILRLPKFGEVHAMQGSSEMYIGPLLHDVLSDIAARIVASTHELARFCFARIGQRLFSTIFYDGCAAPRER